jgi:hypothetical protein
MTQGKHTGATTVQTGITALVWVGKSNNGHLTAPSGDLKSLADSTRQCNFTHGMMREAAMPKCFSPSKVKEHECEPITASLKVSVTKFMH